MSSPIGKGPTTGPGLPVQSNEHPFIGRKRGRKRGKKRERRAVSRRRGGREWGSWRGGSWREGRGVSAEGDW